MTPRRPRDIGTTAETAVVRTLQTRGFPHAERRALRGTHDAGDITGTPGLCWSVKGGQAAKEASDGKVAVWLAELEKQRANAGADLGVLVLQRANIGLGNAHRWWAVSRLLVVTHTVAYGDPAGAEVPVRMHLGDLCALLTAAGYGNPT